MTLMYESLAMLAGFVLLYSLVARGVERTWVSGPIVFTVFGLLIGPMGLDLLSFETERETLKTLAELTLALVLFTDAADADLGVLRRSARLPVRLLVYAVLSLTLIRMLPVFLALTGSGMNTESKLFIGWFGPRGLASIVFGVIVVNANLTNSHAMAVVVVYTVVLSILVHGVTANPWARAYGERMRRRQVQ